MAGHLDVVQAVKAELEAQGAVLSGACGAFKITNRVAARVGFGLLLKAGGNRAVPQIGGGCMDGDHTTAPGYATDYIIDPATFFGYDILGDGGGANTPQWPDEPETDAEMVKRNRENFRPPVPDGNAPPPPPPPPPPIDIPPGQIDVIALVKAFSLDVAALKASVAELKTIALKPQHYEGRANLPYGLSGPVTLDRKP